MYQHTKIVTRRLLYIALFVTIQAAVLVVTFEFFWDKFPFFYVVCVVLSVFSAAKVLNSNSNPAYKLAWLVPILVLPIFGGLFYIMFGRKRHGRKFLRTESMIRSHCSSAIGIVPTSEKQLEEENEYAALHSRYIKNASGCPPFSRTETEYFPVGESMNEALVRELLNAKKFIFMEYFIIEEGVMWNRILEILEQKVQQGVEVRMMYDDLGCLFTLPEDYYKTLRKKGISAIAFNPFNTILSPRFNNRDHRKICVIDGNVGFTGGINLADEYINVHKRFGHWKDTGVMLRGSAVWSLTVQFLSLWDVCADQKDDFNEYQPDMELCRAMPENGFVQPYSDIPMDDELVGETVYMNMINRAKKYVYIMTPYLIIDNEMLTALKTAAKSGVDVRIITPHVPDKKTVFFVTRSYYRPLIEGGVKIYEYTPGFIHAKTMVADGEYAVVGTINLDYRSLYLHYECAVWMYESSAVGAACSDFLQTQQLCEEITRESMDEYSWIKRFFLSILRIFAPLM